MCRCCQSLLECSYWHLYAKWRFDLDIALYEEDEQQVKQQPGQQPTTVDYTYADSVSAIAARSAIICQQPTSATRHNNLTDEQKEAEKRALRDRKKSLKERRKSTAQLTLDLTRGDFHEVPIIRQGSVPKFYDSYTPELNPFTVGGGALTSPVLAAPDTPRYDLASVVQLAVNHRPAPQQTTGRPSRLAALRRKMPPLALHPRRHTHTPATARSMPNIHTLHL